MQKYATMPFIYNSNYNCVKYYFLNIQGRLKIPNPGLSFSDSFLIVYDGFSVSHLMLTNVQNSYL